VLLPREHIRPLPCDLRPVQHIPLSDSKHTHIPSASMQKPLSDLRHRSLAALPDLAYRVHERVHLDRVRRIHRAQHEQRKNTHRVLHLSALPFSPHNRAHTSAPALPSATGRSTRSATAKRAGGGTSAPNACAPCAHGRPAARASRSSTAARTAGASGRSMSLEKEPYAHRGQKQEMQPGPPGRTARAQREFAYIDITARESTKKWIGKQDARRYGYGTPTRLSPLPLP
jgi:hypothetical protein